MLAWRYEFYVVARTISHSFAVLTHEILFLPLEHKIHIFSPPCNILYIVIKQSVNTGLKYLTRSYNTIWQNIHLISGNVCMKWASFWSVSCLCSGLWLTTKCECDQARHLLYQYYLFTAVNETGDSTPEEFLDKDVFEVDAILGIYLDEHLNWKTQIAHVQGKLTKNLGVLNQLRNYLILIMVQCVGATIIRPI